MSNNLINKRYFKEIESELFIDNIMLNKNKNPFSNKNINNNKVIKSNILLNTLQEFIERYEVDERKIISKKKFIISFQELIYLIRESIIAQQKIDTLIYNDNNDNNKKILNNIIIQKAKQKYINDLSYNIFSFDKIDMDYNFTIKKKTKNKTNNSPNMNYKNKKNNNSQSVPDGIKNEINTIFENIYKEVFINGNNTVNNSKVNQRNNKSQKINNLFKNTNKSNGNVNNKSAILKRNISSFNDQRILKDKKEKKINNDMIANNISNNNSNSNSINYNSTNFIKSYINNSSTQSLKNINKYSSKERYGSQHTNSSAIKLKKIKTSNDLFSENIKKGKKELKCSDIFLACETLHNIRNSSNKKILSKSSNINMRDLNGSESFLKKSLRDIGLKDSYNITFTDIAGFEELKFNKCIKKIIVSNTHKPSNLANQLLLSGQKFIEDFKEINENKKKKSMNSKYK